MATTDAPPQAGGQAPGAHAGTPDAAAADAATGRPGAGRTGGQRPVLRAFLATEALIVLFAVGFLVYLFGLSSVSEARAQNVLSKSFANELGQLTAPNGPAAEGAPVALLNIPQIGLRKVVVVEGTTSRDLTHGPGLVPESVLPGQSGVSVIYGKAVSYGAPFANLMQLNRGDRITVTTNQGTATYVVESFGTSARPGAHPAPADAANRLILETAGPGLVPRGAVQVSADLVSSPRSTPTNQPANGPEEADMAWYPDGLIPVLLWCQALLIVVIAATVAANRWSRGPAYLCAAPVLIALLWSVYENLATVLPNLY